MTACLNRLERRGLISRTPDETDRRSLVAMLTDQGVQLVDDAIASHFSAAERTVDGLDRSERAELARLLRKLRLRLD
jgi:DNA-binding MarR family transcriptional regulator